MTKIKVTGDHKGQIQHIKVKRGNNGGDKSRWFESSRNKQEKIR